MVDEALVKSVSHLALFADLEPDELDVVLTGIEEVALDEGQWVLRRGQTGVGLYIIVDGEVGVLLADEELATLSRGSFFGEISCLLGEPIVADVLARTPLRCLFVPDEDVEGFLTRNPRVMYRMLQAEARRLRTTDELRL
jgi:CRP/FNR family transcriptional regulator, cyclic AMP receptor protein